MPNYMQFAVRPRTFLLNFVHAASSTSSVVFPSSTPLATPTMVRQEPGSRSTSLEGGTSEKHASAGSSNPALVDHSEPVRSPVSAELERRGTLGDARSLASIDRPPSKEDRIPPAKIYPPLSPHVLLLLMPASIFGALARVGLLALTTYDGREIFPLAWIQAAGCLVMGFGLGLKEPIGQL